jgi:hypothetical protein
MAEDAGVAAAAFDFADFVRAAGDADALARAGGDAAATLAAGLQATTPTNSTAEPANSARIPIADPLHSVCLLGSVWRRRRRRRAIKG